MTRLRSFCGTAPAQDRGRGSAGIRTAPSTNRRRWAIILVISNLAPPIHQESVLFLWGGVDAEGTPHLDPAFVLDAPASLPRADGAHGITGRAADGTELFSLSFRMPVIADGDGSSSFVFAVPVEEGWADALASITLSGPGGSFTLDRNTDRPMAILRNPESGQIRQIMRDLPRGPAGREAAERAGTETGFEVLFSRGIPDPADWKR
ncbi:MAG: hypothetical protein OXL34_14015 [Gemmatimonadota bacterium]|nr:hypothetical protein [Gemmatimonadota bacterium]